MTATLRSSSNLQLLSEAFAAKNAPLVVVPWSMFGTRRLQVTTEDGQLVGWVDLKTGHCSLAMPELASAFEIALSAAEEAPTEAAHSRMSRRALDEAIELALLAGQAAPDAPESRVAYLAESRPANQLEICTVDSESPTLMRRGYRGTSAYSSSVGAFARRLVEEELVSVDPHWAYLNATSGGYSDANIATCS